MVDKRLLEIIVCPACKSDVADHGQKLVCNACGRIYPVKNEIPVMLVEESGTRDKT